MPPSALWEHVLELPEPRFVVVQDLDDPPGVGSYWGEVNGSIFTALRCVAVFTNGAVRDLTEMQAIGIQAFAGCVAVSHAYVHLVGVGEPVTVGGLAVRPGDLLHGDQHGVLSIPFEIAGALAAATRSASRRRNESSSTSAVRLTSPPRLCWHVSGRRLPAPAKESYATDKRRCGLVERGAQLSIAWSVGEEEVVGAVRRLNSQRAVGQPER